MTRKKIVIIGGGMTGLCTADQLSRRGNFDVLLLEKESEIGGLARGAVVGDQVFDLGPHALWTKLQSSYQYCKDLCGDDLVDLGPKKVAIMFRGKQVPYPLRMSATLLRLGWGDSFTCFKDYLAICVKNFIREPDCRSFEDYVSSHYGKRLYEIFFRDYTAKTWGIPPAELAASFASERIPKISILRAVRKTFTQFLDRRETRSAGKHTFRTLYYPRHGYRSFTRKIEENIVKQGVRVQKNTEVVRLETENRRVKRVVFKSQGGESSAECDHLISTMPLNLLASQLGEPPADVRGAAGRLRFREMTMLFLVVRKPSVYQHQWVYYQDNAIYTHRVYETKVFGAGVSPNPDETGLCCEITNRDHLDPNKLFERVVADFERLGLFTRNDVKDWKVMEVPYAYPLYDLSYRETLATLLRHVQTFFNVITAGRQGLFVYVDTDHCMEKGRIIADHLIDGKSLDPLYSVVAAHSMTTT